MRIAPGTGVVFACLFLASQGLAAEDLAKKCKMIVYNSQASYAVTSSPTVAAHFKFSKKIDLINNTLPSLWDITKSDQDLWVRGKSIDEAVATVGITVKFLDQTTVNLIIKNKENAGDCYNFVAEEDIDRVFNHNDKLDKALEEARAEKEKAETARQYYIEKQTSAIDKFKKALERLKIQAATQTEDAIEDWKERIYTGYAIKAEKPARYQVSAAYDDGLFTYIRINQSAFGVPVLVKKDKEKTLILDYSFNDLTGVFTVRGLHQSLALELDGEATYIERYN